MTDELSYRPERLTIAAGTTVIWTNRSALPHTVIADPAGAVLAEHARLPPNAPAIDSGVVEPGDSFSYTFTIPGKYAYFCSVHEMAGMTGTIVVE